MKEIIIKIIMVVLFMSFFTSAQDILWKKNFGLNTADDFGQSVIESNDGNIVVAGYTGSYGAGGFDVWLIKTNTDGDTIWAKTYGGSGDDYAYSLKQTEDGGFIIGGATNSYGAGGADFYLIKTDSLGDSLWTRTYGDVNDDFCRDIEITDDGYIIVGEKNLYSQPPADILILKYNMDGQREWVKILGESGDDRASSIIKIESNYFIVGGQWNFGGVLIKINQFGDTLWTKKYPSNYGSFNSIDQLPGEQFIITCKLWGGGTNVWDLGLLKTDSLGNEIWSKTYDYQEDADIGYSVQQTSDGGFIVCGNAQVDGGSYFGWIIRTNSVGDTLWTKELHSYVTFSVQSSINTICYSVIQTLNGDYIVTGNQPILPVSDHAQQLMLLRIASDIVPVELTSFTATVTQNSVSLNWQTATETNNSGFEIERTSPLPSPYEGEGGEAGRGWDVVAFVPGFGTTTEPKSYSFVDENFTTGKYQYRLKQIDFDGSFEYSNTVEVEVMVTKDYSLSQNYPNPFNPATLISFSIPNDEFVSLRIYDVLGREVAQIINERKSAGTHQIEFSGASLNSGVYYYTLTAGSYTETKKMLLIK